MKYDIFISYRREGGYDTAKHLNDLLVRDGYRVSFDIDTLRNGDFDEQLLERIEQCKDFILIVDEHAFDRTIDPTFVPQKDWLRCELSHALKNKKNIIPIFLSNVYSFPENLPLDVADIVKRNGPQYSRYYFDDFYNKLKKDFLKSNKHKIRIRASKILYTTLLITVLLASFILVKNLTTVNQKNQIPQIMNLNEFKVYASKTLKNRLSIYNSEDYDKIIKSWKDKALGGDAYAQYNLGLCYYTGFCIEENTQNALEWFIRSAEQNLVEAEFSLKICLQNGISIDENFCKELYIDLGLKSGTLWATHNLGANKIYEIGYYLAWGEIEEKTVYNISTYPETYYKMFNTVNNNSICSTKFDAATVLLGNNWALPSYEQALELYKECNWIYTKNYNSTGVPGCICVGPNGNHIFFPAGGLMMDTIKSYYGFGNYWVGSLENYNNIDWANFIDFNHTGLCFQKLSRDHRFWGRNIKAVYNKNR